MQFPRFIRHSVPTERTTFRLALAAIGVFGTLLATACGVSSPIQVDARLAEATIEVVAGQDQVTTVGAPAPEPLVARVADPSGAPLVGVQVTWTFQEGLGRQVGGASGAQEIRLVTNEDGHSEVEWVLGTGAGQQQGSVEIVYDAPEAATSTAAGAPGNGRGKKDGFFATGRPGQARAVSIDPSPITTSEGSTVQLSAAVEDEFGNEITDSDLRWSSTDPSVARVDDSGMAMAVGEGSAQITAKTGPAEGSTSVTVAGDAPRPGVVSDLAVTESTASSVTVTFTQVSDGTGSPADYAIRYGSPTIAWGGANTTEVSVTGTEIGTMLAFEYTGLDAETEYELQLVAYRGTLGEVVVFGDLSNVAGGTTGPNIPGPASSVHVTPTSATVNGVGKTVQFVAEATDSAGNPVDASFEWSSEDESIASVSREGLVTSKAIGNTTIVATLLCGSTACLHEGVIAGASFVEVEEVLTSEPGTVADLTVLSTSETTATLRFTEVDDGRGNPSNYALRYGSPSIDWGPAQPTEISILGEEIGARRLYDVTDLAPGSSYEFQLVAYRGTLGVSAEFGDLSNVAGGDTDEDESEAGAPVSIRIIPANGTIRGIGRSLQFTAEALDARDIVVTGAAIDWTSDDRLTATVTANGLVTGHRLGTTTIVASLCVSGCALGPGGGEFINQEATLTVEEASAAHPNEPGDLQTWFEHDFQTMPLMGNDDWHRASSGTGYFKAWNADNWPSENVEFVDDMTAPSGKALRIRAANGWGSGFSNGVNMSVRSTAGGGYDDPATVKLRDIYLSYWVYFEPNPADGNYVETSIFRQWTANRQIIGTPSNFGLSFRSVGGTGFRDIWLWGRDSPSSGPVTFAAREPGPQAGTWYQIELLVERTSFGGTQPTRFQMWVNGTQIVDDLDSSYMGYAFAELFFNPNRSGGGSRSRTDYFRIADFYVSGRPIG